MHMNRDMNRPALRVDASAYPAGAALLSASGVPDVAPAPDGGRVPGGNTGRNRRAVRFGFVFPCCPASVMCMCTSGSRVIRTRRPSARGRRRRHAAVTPPSAPCRIWIPCRTVRRTCGLDRHHPPRRLHRRVPLRCADGRRARHGSRLTLPAWHRRRSRFRTTAGAYKART